LGSSGPRDNWRPRWPAPARRLFSIIRRKPVKTHLPSIKLQDGLDQAGGRPLKDIGPIELGHPSILPDLGTGVGDQGQDHKVTQGARRAGDGSFQLGKLGLPFGDFGVGTIEFITSKLAAGIAGFGKTLQNPFCLGDYGGLFDGGGGSVDHWCAPGLVSMSMPAGSTSGGRADQHIRAAEFGAHGADVGVKCCQHQVTKSVQH
jgi:hypothetical protein